MESSCVSAGWRACFMEEDQGLASLAEMEAPGNSGNLSPCHRHSQPIRQHSLFARRASDRSAACFRTLSGPIANCCYSRSGARSWDGRFEDGPRHQLQPPHFLEACALCRKPLGHNRDIFMYRGDTPFCSEECRQEQIEKDESREKMESSKALMKEASKSNTPAKPKSSYRFRAGAVVAA